MENNLQTTHSVATEKLFYSKAFVVGFADGYNDAPFKYTSLPGPGSTLRSSQLAYERGRQFGVIWRGRSTTNLSIMQRELSLLHIAGIIT